MKKLIATLLLISILLTACKQPANPSVSDQSGNSSDSNVSSSIPNSSGSLSSNSSSSLSSSSEPSIPPLSSDANGEILFFGQPINEVNFYQYVVENQYFDDSIPEGVYLRNLVHALSFDFPYPESISNPSLPNSEYLRTLLTNFIYNIYKNGFNGKTLDDFDVVNENDYTMAIGDPHIIPLEDAVAALSTYFGNIDAEEIIKSSKIYDKEKNAVIDTYPIDGLVMPVLIGNITVSNNNTLNMTIYYVAPAEYKTDFEDLDKYIDSVSQYTKYRLTFQLYPDHWQYLKGEKEIKYN